MTRRALRRLRRRYRSAVERIARTTVLRTAPPRRDQRRRPLHRVFDRLRRELHPPMLVEFYSLG
jgi:hypothetical protein